MHMEVSMRRTFLATPLLILALVLASAHWSGSPRASEAAGPVVDPTTNHFYEAVAVPGGITWVDAQAAASTRTYLGCTGHLATITSQAENNFIIANFPQAGGIDAGAGLPLKDSMGYWIGGHTIAIPTYGWVTGEPFVYTNWAPGEPNFDTGQDGVHFDPRPFGDGVIGKWNDAHDETWMFPGYVVEYSCFPESSELCKKDGWKSFLNGNGRMIFKNQGDCVSFIATKFRNLPSGQ